MAAHVGPGAFCLSLGLERDKFDNKTVTFEEHIKEEHNMWHYLCFIVLVKVKDSTEYTGPESYVAEMIKVGGPWWQVARTPGRGFHTGGAGTSGVHWALIGDQALDSRPLCRPSGDLQKHQAGGIVRILGAEMLRL